MKIQYVSELTADHIGSTVSFPTWSALGYCRKGTLHAIQAAAPGTITLQINDHLHTVPVGARIDVLDTVEVRGL